VRREAYQAHGEKTGEADWGGCKQVGERTSKADCAYSAWQLDVWV